ncbi:MAG: GNAT family N-acetyltransferase [Solirubrobacterales bacterium]|nr:GNAT family N-acetyltransferase [Solirubrobacterales bacterium]MBV9713751.1 GNAT family N-acetyltransferase [Solirubrobacterales bacterium]
MSLEDELVRVRTGTPADLAVLRDLFRRSSLSNEGDRDALLANPHTLKFAGERLAQGTTRVAVGVDGRIVGFITSVTLGNSVLEVEDMFVDPHRMRRGIGRQLMQDLVTTARRAGVARIEVTANPHAEAFYRSVGFVRTHELEMEFGPASRMQLTLARNVP